jgi:hypothetical protein
MMAAAADSAGEEVAQPREERRRATPAGFDGGPRRKKPKKTTREWSTPEIDGQPDAFVLTFKVGKWESNVADGYEKGEGERRKAKGERKKK